MHQDYEEIREYKLYFNSQLKKLKEVPISQKLKNDLKNEPMLFSCDLEFAMNNGGPITQKVLENLPAGWYGESIIDTRVHMLKEGFYPAIPGFHQDSVPRNEKGPIYERSAASSYNMKHLTLIVHDKDQECCSTEFVTGEIGVPIHKGSARNLYEAWDNYLVKQIQGGAIVREPSDWNQKLVSIKSCAWYQFTWETFHRAVPSSGDCWRYFIRLSKNEERNLKPAANEIRRQVQVYIDPINKGW